MKRVKIVGLAAVAAAVLAAVGSGAAEYSLPHDATPTNQHQADLLRTLAQNAGASPATLAAVAHRYDSVSVTVYGHRVQTLAMLDVALMSVRGHATVDALTNPQAIARAAAQVALQECLYVSGKEHGFDVSGSQLQKVEEAQIKMAQQLHAALPLPQGMSPQRYFHSQEFARFYSTQQVAQHEAAVVTGQHGALTPAQWQQHDRRLRQWARAQFDRHVTIAGVPGAHSPGDLADFV